MNIDKNIPLPQKKNGRKISEIGQTVRALQVGDSFECTKGQMKTAMALQWKIPVDLTSRHLGDGKYRVWRVK